MAISSYTGRIVARYDDDAPVPLTGRITGRVDADRVEVAWADEAYSDDPRTDVEWIEELRPVDRPHA
jgi:hypothetical protein